MPIVTKLEVSQWVKTQVTIPQTIITLIKECEKRERFSGLCIQQSLLVGQRKEKPQKKRSWGMRQVGVPTWAYRLRDRNPKVRSGSPVWTCESYTGLVEDRG